MKIRTDFITNSSSSSFIVGKAEDNITKEDVYQMLLGFYKDFYKKRDQLKKQLEENDTGLTFVENEDYDCVRCLDGSYIPYDQPREDIFKPYGFNSFTYFPKKPEWLDKCHTYNEYEKYWLEILQKKDKADYNTHAPFTIIDFSEDKVRWLHYGNGEIEPNDNGMNSDILEWYYPYLEDCLEDRHCDDCRHSDWCNRDECKNTKMEIRGKKFTEDNVCLVLLGKICVSSESGYIPEYVEEHLAEHCEQYCGHMG